MLDMLQKAYRTTGGAVSEDVYLGPFNSYSANAITEIQGPIHAIGLTGNLPPGALVLFAGREHRADLASAISAVNSAERLSRVYGRTGSALASNSILTNNITVLRPGDTLQFDVPLDGAVAWSYSLLGTSSLSAYGMPTTGFTAELQHLLAPAAVLRVLRTPGALPALSYTPAPWVHGDDQPSASAPSASTDGVSVYGATHATIHVLELGGLVRLTVSVDLALWWYTPAGRWARNAANDFSGAGLGSATSTHDVETFEIPYNATRLYLQKTGANDCTAMAILTERR